MTASSPLSLWTHTTDGSRRPAASPEISVSSGAPHGAERGGARRPAPCRQLGRPIRRRGHGRPHRPGPCCTPRRGSRSCSPDRRFRHRRARRRDGHRTGQRRRIGRAGGEHDAQHHDTPSPTHDRRPYVITLTITDRAVSPPAGVTADARRPTGFVTVVSHKDELDSYGTPRPTSANRDALCTPATRRVPCFLTAGAEV